jgi:hypothetical protein
MVEMLGAERLVYGRLGDAQLFTLRIEGALPPPRPGDRVHLASAAPPALVRRHQRPIDSASEAPVMRPPPGPILRWIAHRGAGKLAPGEHAGRLPPGRAHGYRAFECDVKLSADGVPFLLHDATLERTTSATGTAGERPWHRAVAAGRRQLALARLRRRAPTEPGARSRPSCSATASRWMWRSSPAPAPMRTPARSSPPRWRGCGTAISACRC